MADKWFYKDPGAVLDYTWDWKALTNVTGASDWLATGETISSCTVTAPAGITVASYAAANTNTSVIAWLSGGYAPNDYDVVCEIVTTASRTDQRTITIKVRQR